VSLPLPHAHVHECAGVVKGTGHLRGCNIGSMELSQRKLDFCRYYVDQPIAQDAAMRAGYALTTARVNSHKWLANPSVATEIARLTEAKNERIDLDGDEVVRRLWLMAQGDDRDQPTQFALGQLVKVFRLSVEGLTINVDARNQVAALTDAQLAEALQAAPGPALPLIETEP